MDPRDTCQLCEGGRWTGRIVEARWTLIEGWRLGTIPDTIPGMILDMILDTTIDMVTDTTTDMITDMNRDATQGTCMRAQGKRDSSRAPLGTTTMTIGRHQAENRTHRRLITRRAAEGHGRLVCIRCRHQVTCTLRLTREHTLHPILATLPSLQIPCLEIHGTHAITDVNPECPNPR